MVLQEPREDHGASFSERYASSPPIVFRQPEGAEAATAARPVQDAVQHDWGRIAAADDSARPEDVSILGIEGA